MKEHPWKVSGPVPAPTDAVRSTAPAVWLRHGSPAHVIVLGTEVVAVPVHWAGGRNVPCWRPEPCAHCDLRVPRRAQYHIAVWECTRGRDGVLVVGSSGCAALLNVASAESQLRGLEVLMHKLKAGNRAGTTCQLITKHDPAGSLRAAFPLTEQLCRLFGTTRIPEMGG